MSWIKAKNGNVFEVADEVLVAKLESEGCEVYEEDPRKTKPKK